MSSEIQRRILLFTKWIEVTYLYKPMKYNRILLFVKLKVTNQFNSIVIILIIILILLII